MTKWRRHGRAMHRAIRKQDRRLNLFRVSAGSLEKWGKRFQQLHPEYAAAFAAIREQSANLPEAPFPDDHPKRGTTPKHR